MTTLFARESQQYEAVGLEEGELPAEAEIELSGGVGVAPDANPATTTPTAATATAAAAAAAAATASPAPKPCPSPRLPDEPKLEVVKFLDIKGKTWEMADVPLRWSVAELKMAVEGDTGCDVDRQRLIYSGKVLKDEQTVAEAKIQNNTVIHLFQRPPKAALPVASAVPAGASVTNPLHSGLATATAAPSSAVAVAAGGSGAVGVAVDGAAGNDEADPSLAFLHDMEVVEARRRVRLLASILLLISGLNVVTDFVELVNFVFKGTFAELLRLIFRLCVNGLGVYVGMNGVKASQTLDEHAVYKYVWGLVVVGALYISNDVWMLINVATTDPDEPDAPVPEPTASSGDDDMWDDDAGSDPNQPDAITTDDAADFTPNHATLVNQASMSLLISVMIWTLCFYRAFALRRAVRDRMPR